MTGLFSPDGVQGFDEIRSIDRAVMLKEYLSQIEEEESRIKALIEDLCAQAISQDDTATDGWKLVVRYASGVTVKPDVSMLAVSFPDRYRQLFDEQIKTFKPSLTKTDVEWLFADIPKEDRDNLVSEIMVEHPVKPQYVLQAKKEAGA